MRFRGIFFALIFLFLCFRAGAQSRADSIKRELKKEIHDSTRCKLLNFIVHVVNEEDPDTALIVSAQAINLSELNLKSLKNGSPAYRSFRKTLLHAYANSAGIQQSLGQFKIALELRQKCLDLSKELNDQAQLAVTLTSFGEIYSVQGQTDKAFDYYQQALSIAEKIGDKKRIGYTYIHLGNIYTNKGDIEKGITHFQKALSIFESIKDKVGIAAILNNLGFVYAGLGDYRKALDYFQKAGKISEEIRDKSGLGSNYNNMATIYYHLKNEEKSLEYFKKSLEIRIEIKDNIETCNLLTNIGNVYMNQKKLKEALDYFVRALKMQEELQDKEGMAYTCLNLATAYGIKKDFTMEQRYFERTLAIGKTMGYPRIINAASLKLYQFHKARHHYAEALSNYEMHIKMRDSLNNEKTRKASIKSQLKYEFEKKAAADSVAHLKEREIKNVELAKQRAEIKAKKGQQYALFGGLFLVVLFSIFMYNRFKITQKQKVVIEHQKEIVEEQKLLVEEKQREVLESIHYAKRIQMAQIPSEKRVQVMLTRLKS
jgi:tetratricopeptide (TPR) repeat protein